MYRKKYGHEVLRQHEQLALLYRDHKETPYIVACGYNEKDGTWKEAYFYTTFSEAVKHYMRPIKEQERAKKRADKAKENPA